MNSRPWRKAILSSLFLLLSLLMSQCAAQKGELNTHGETDPPRVFPPDRVFSLKEVNVEKVFEECRGMMVLEENATTVRDYYRGAVQEKEKGKKLLREGRWEEAEARFKKSNRYLEKVTEYLPEDDPRLNVYEGHFLIFVPHLLMADNHLELARIYKKMTRKGDVYWTLRQGREDLAQSLKTSKTEWAYKLKKEFEEEMAGR